MSTRGMSGGATTATPPADSPPPGTASMRRPCRPAGCRVRSPPPRRCWSACPVEPAGSWAMYLTVLSGRSGDRPLTSAVTSRRWRAPAPRTSSLWWTRSRSGPSRCSAKCSPRWTVTEKCPMPSSNPREPRRIAELPACADGPGGAHVAATVVMLLRADCGTSGRFTDRPGDLSRLAFQRRLCAASCGGPSMRGQSSLAISLAPPPTFSIRDVRIAGAVLGIVIVAAVWVAVTLLIPRGRVGYIKVVDRLVDRVYIAGGRLVRSWDRRDALLASQPVVTVGIVLFTWLAGFVVGYGLLLWLLGGSLPESLREAGSSLFTLGFAARRSAEPSVVDFFTAASGLVIVALQIAYLPTLYAAYNRRETEVTLLGPRAGSPAWGPELLARVQIADGIEQLTVIYEGWERWSADVAESHSSYPSLLRFRSPEPHSSWVVSQLGRAGCRRSSPGGVPGGRAFHCPALRADGLHLPAEADPHVADPRRRRSAA